MARVLFSEVLGRRSCSLLLWQRYRNVLLPSKRGVTENEILALGFSTCATRRSIPLTVDLHPELKRGDFAKVEQADVSAFLGMLSPERVLTEKDDVAAFCTDWLKLYRGTGSVVLKPNSTAELSQILSYCNSRKLAVVPQGGLTGLVGGGVPVFDEVIISTSLLNKVISVDQVAGILVCQSGCVLETLDNFLAEKGLMMPLDLGAKGSCQIGGNVSTNAGGLRLVRYGSLHGSVLGLEVVLADGTVVDCLSTLRKDNTGYDIKQLFIGSEGTLGIVTAVAIATPPRPQSISVCLIGCKTFQNVQETFIEARRQLGEILSAVEFMDAQCMALVQKNLGLVNPLSSEFPFVVLIEAAGSNATHDEEKVASFVESALSKGFIEDGTLATEPSKIRSIWELRERLADALLKDGVQRKFDISLPIARLYDIVEVMRERVGSRANSVLGYGHLGDGNIHLNITSERHDKALDDDIVPFVYEWTATVKGSISAEHGLGVMKPQHIGFSKSAAAVNLMRTIKASLDPKGILNPYKVLTPSNEPKSSGVRHW